MIRVIFYILYEGVENKKFVAKRTSFAFISFTIFLLQFIFFIDMNLLEVGIVGMRFDFTNLQSNIIHVSVLINICVKVKDFE
jgi:uncharacterized membrane protein YidH (DUF202 family)